MTTPTIIACVIVILLALLSIPLIKSSLAKKRQRVVEKQLKESKQVTEKEKIRVYLDKINEESRNKYRD
jgi:predicted Holliday junction resolvase-like endonuclease